MFRVFSMNDAYIGDSCPYLSYIVSFQNRFVNPFRSSILKEKGPWSMGLFLSFFRNGTWIADNYATGSSLATSCWDFVGIPLRVCHLSISAGWKP